MLHRLPDVPGVMACWEVELGCDEIVIEGYDVTVSSPERHQMRGVVLCVLEGREEQLYLVTWSGRSHGAFPVRDDGEVILDDDFSVEHQAHVLFAWGDALRLARRGPGDS